MRIVALSDQHGYLPDIPECDLLLIAGDVCPDRIGPFEAMHDFDQQKRWFDRQVRPWLAAVPAAHKILTWGNHDWCGQMCSFRDASTSDLQIIVDAATTVRAAGDEVTVWATPWSNLFMDWAFMKRPEELEAVYAQIPTGIDILVSHQPPYGHGDSYFGFGAVEHLGSHELLTAIERVRPRLVVCGHFHGGYGRSEYSGVPIYNVSVVDEEYRLAHAPTVIDFAAA